MVRFGFFVALKCLECLNLRDCSCLRAESLSLIRGMALAPSGV